MQVSKHYSVFQCAALQVWCTGCATPVPLAAAKRLFTACAEVRLLAR